MENEFKVDLKINKRNYPEKIKTFLLNYERGVDDYLLEINLIDWFKDTFSKGNRWNKGLINANIASYNPDELEGLEKCFKKLFNTNKNTNKDFIRYFLNKPYRSTRNKTSEITLTYEAYLKLIEIMGKMKRNKEIICSYEVISNFIVDHCRADKELRKATIKDRLQNKKYYADNAPKK